MSDIKEMNKTIRKHSAGWAAVAAVVTAGGISPQAIVEATHGEPTGKLAWSSLVIIFGAIMLLLEAADVGRHTPHRNKVDKHTTELLMNAACLNKQCPEVSNPTNQTQNAAMDEFYKLIDKPSREVAFHQWGWYYTSLNWIAFSIIGFLIVIVSWPFASTDFPILRGVSALVLLCMFLGALHIRKTWACKTFGLSTSQARQIPSDLLGSLKATSCTEDPCPLQ